MQQQKNTTNNNSADICSESSSHEFFNTIYEGSSRDLNETNSLVCQSGFVTPAAGNRGKESDNPNMPILLKKWAVAGNNVYKAVSTTINKLQPGMYIIQCDQTGIYFEKKIIHIDDLLRFPNSLSNKILNEIRYFWSCRDKFKKHGFLHRRGYLFHGPAGSGKTCLVHQIVADIINSGDLVFHCDTSPEIFQDGINIFRKIEPDRPIVCLFEDIDALIEEYGEDSILNLLDGTNQIDRVLNIATTNYPEKLDPRIVARPRRFDRVLKIDVPSADVRRVYFNKKLNIPENELNKWVKATDGFSFAACAELVISVCCFEKPFDEAVKIISDMMVSRPHSKDHSSSKNVGFSFKNE